MLNLQQLLIIAILSLFTQYVFAGCSVVTSVETGVTKSPYTVQFVENSTQQVITQLSPIAPGLHVARSVTCSDKPIYAKFFLSEDPKRFYASEPFLLINDRPTLCVLTLDMRVHCNPQPCVECPKK